ncbi:unnamed protein product [Adineta steineri]|uniref:Uncharacterized protein n=1 Tax=Adineta steineri TaxID=433720 RepID=A0A819N3V4_9BILA|nr:unnamed protein product [Adineta steineri]CAF3987967.1 unnamed protein product [Adineta steineri]
MMNQVISVVGTVIILSAIQNIGVSAALPYWCGLYSARYSPCDPQQCCCIENLFYISTPYPFNETSIRFRFGGRCPPNVNLQIDARVLRLTTSSGFSTSLSVFGQQVRLTLSEDSRSLTSNGGGNSICVEQLRRLI